MIKAPYNFVPLSEKVFFPPWADQVSHDIPFSDGESGEIEISITAKSPIFIRDNKHKEEFCQHEGQYYIPGSSVKGMVRNVLEIMSFSKMKFVDDKTFKKNDGNSYKYSIFDGIPDSHKSKNLDLSELLFGYSDDSESLKGRVQFSHFKEVENTCRAYTDSVKLILGTPKASYYPIYLEQGKSTLCITDIHTTYDNDKFKIAGWKRYPLHQSYSNESGVCSDEDKVSTCFHPLDKGAIFRGKIRYHNLKNIELGAILSSILFHKTENTYHNIGLAKAFGFGKIEINIDNIVSKSNNQNNITLNLENIEEYLKIFEKYITQELLEWSSTEQLTELVTMASVHNQFVDDNLVYMPLHGGEDSYVENKRKQDDAYNILCSFSQWDNVTSKNINSFLSSEEIKKLQNEQTLKNSQQEKDIKLKIDEIIENIKLDPNFIIPSNKKLKGAIKSFIELKLDIPYYSAEHLSMYLRGNIDELSSGNFGDIKKEYKKLDRISPLIFNLLKSREFGDISNEDNGVLYFCLNEELNA